MNIPSWKQLKLSLERPYKDEDGETIPVLLDISPEGLHIYEQRESSITSLGENLRRIFVERGVDFFDRTKGHHLQEKPPVNEDEDASGVEEGPDANQSPEQPMSVEELFKMRTEIIPQLFTSLGEINLAKDLLTSLLTSSQPAQESIPTNLSATVVSKPLPVISVQAFNAQLTIGSKDEALRKAANVFKSAANSMERGRIKGEKYWVDALKVRRGNWGLIPAPLPFGSSTGKGADKTSRDFLITYGLEESPAPFRRQALARMATEDADANSLVFLHRQKTRLRVSVSVVNVDGVTVTTQNTDIKTDLESLEGALKVAQQEIVEHEIFSLLVQEAGNLPTASARVSERLIVIDAAQGTELKFELLDDKKNQLKSTENLNNKEKCDLIFFALQALLLRRHSHMKMQRLGTAFINRPPTEMSFPPPILQPIIDLLQYQVFCQRIKLELDKMVTALSAAGICSSLRFDPVGETGRQLVQFFEKSVGKVVGGEGVLRIDNRHTIRLTFLSPSSLTAHLSQATLTISSIPQLCQLLTDEVERCLLQRICDRGKEMGEQTNAGTWFIDLSRCVGRWEGCVLNFHVTFGKDFEIDCSAFQIHRNTSKQGQLDKYSTYQHKQQLIPWIDHIISAAPVPS